MSYILVICKLFRFRQVLYFRWTATALAIEQALGSRLEEPVFPGRWIWQTQMVNSLGQRHWKNTDLLKNLSWRKIRGITEIHRIFTSVNSRGFLTTGVENQNPWRIIMTRVRIRRDPQEIPRVQLPFCWRFLHRLSCKILKKSEGMLRRYDKWSTVVQFYFNQQWNHKKVNITGQHQ